MWLKFHKLLSCQEFTCGDNQSSVIWLLYVVFCWTVDISKCKMALILRMLVYISGRSITVSTYFMCYFGEKKLHIYNDFVSCNQVDPVSL